MRWGAKRSDALRVGVTENLVTLGKNISVRYYRLSQIRLSMSSGLTFPKMTPIWSTL